MLVHVARVDCSQEPQAPHRLAIMPMIGGILTTEQRKGRTYFPRQREHAAMTRIPPNCHSGTVLRPEGCCHTDCRTSSQQGQGALPHQNLLPKCRGDATAYWQPSLPPLFTTTSTSMAELPCRSHTSRICTTGQSTCDTSYTHRCGHQRRHCALAVTPLRRSPSTWFPCSCHTRTAARSHMAAARPS